MEKNIIQCPYCLKESQKGVHVCTGCQASVLYGSPPNWCILLVIFGTFMMSILISMIAGIAAGTISLPIVGIVAFIVSKMSFSDRVSFRRRM